MNKFLTFISFSLIAVGVVALITAADKPVTPLPAGIETMDGRIRVSYWATPEEKKAYKFLIDLNAEQNGMILREDTSSYTPTNGFQVFMEAQFKSWHNLRLVTEHNREIVAAASEMQSISIEDIAKVRAMVKILSPKTNPPALPAGGQ